MAGHSKKPGNPFRLDDIKPDSPLTKFLYTFRRPLEFISGLGALAEMYDSLDVPDSDFVKSSLAKLNVRYEITSGSLDAIPKTGPVVIIANHPFGGLEGVILIDLLSSIRPDVKLMANGLLNRVRELRQYFIGVDPFGTTDSFAKNVTPMKDTLAWLQHGGALGIFPGGTVSHLQLDRREISDPEWSSTISRLVSKTKCPVVPIFFEGTNGPLFQLLGLIHPLLRTAMLPREMANKQGERIRLKVGQLIPYERLHSLETPEKILAYLRFKTYVLADKPLTGFEKVAGSLFGKSGSKRKLESIIREEPKAVLSREVENLPPSQLLFTDDKFQVYYARAGQIPHLLREIGRLREVTFRLVQEGTGKSIDLDQYDNYYLHLFIWNTEAHEIVGAYRLGKADRIVRRFGIKGLYTSTLFDYQPGLMEQINPALEMGRSFIRSEYQRNYSALLLLWKGIGHYVAKHPRYKMLFGPVSINSEYESISRQLIIHFLEENASDPELAAMIRAKNPMKVRNIRGVDAETTSIVVRDVEEVSDLLQEIQSSQKNIPVLLRQYLKLGGVLLGFNVDKSFGDVLDGLLLVDLTKTEPKMLERYFGKEGVKSFYAYHGITDPRYVEANSQK